MTRARARLTIGALFVAALIISGTSAIAQTRPPAQLVTTHQAATVGFDVYLYRPVLKSVLQTPPKDTLIEFDIRAFVSAYPRTYHTNVTLRWWRSARALHRPKGRWVDIHPTQGWGITDLCQVGTSCRLRPILTWTCEQGAFYVRIHTFGISHSGKPGRAVNFFPWKGFVKGHPRKGNDQKPPPLKLAWHTKCAGSDALQG